MWPASYHRPLISRTGKYVSTPAMTEWINSNWKRLSPAPVVHPFSTPVINFYFIRISSAGMQFVILGHYWGLLSILIRREIVFRYSWTLMRILECYWRIICGPFNMLVALLYRISLEQILLRFFCNVAIPPPPPPPEIFVRCKRFVLPLLSPVEDF